MKTSFDQIIRWMKEICEEKPGTFSSCFLGDVMNYLDLEDADEKSLEELCGEKFSSLVVCNTKEEVRAWLENVTSFIVMRIDEQAIIDNYFNN